MHLRTITFPKKGTVVSNIWCIMIIPTHNDLKPTTELYSQDSGHPDQAILSTPFIQNSFLQRPYLSLKIHEVS
jgi:hypothetical protein